MLYTVEELAERCGVTVEFIDQLRQEGGRFQPVAHRALHGKLLIDLYDGCDALTLLWVKTFVSQGEGFPEACKSAEEVLEEYFHEPDEYYCQPQGEDTDEATDGLRLEGNTNNP